MPPPPAAATPVATLWERLLSVALVGTERKPPPTDALAQVATLLAPPHDAADAAAAAAADTETAEVGVVTAAGVVAAYRRVGLVVEHSDAGLPEAAAVDERAEASATAAQLLGLLLEGHVRVLGGPTELVEDWLVRCSAGGRRPPARLLPGLLDHATRILALRPAVATAGGPRAVWLATQNPHWAWAAEAGQDSAAGDDEVWRTGAAGARLAVLAARRATDPAGARALVEETWSGEKAKDRAQIVDVLRTGLGLDDEAFLEERLDDRAPSVRAAAAELLATLPGSQLEQRMTDRVRPLVAHHRRREKLEISLPDPPDAAARRDGIADAGAPSGTGRRTWWLIQLVGATPLTFWTGELGLSPADAVQQAQQRELVDGWVLAASRRNPAGGGGAPTWARELLRVAPDPRLLRALPPEQARDLLPVALERATDPAVAGLLVATPAPWPALLSQWVVHRLRANRNAVALDRSLTRLAAAGDAEIIPDLERWIDELRLHDRLRTTLRDVAHTLSIRRTIAQELS